MSRKTNVLDITEAITIIELGLDWNNNYCKAYNHRKGNKESNMNFVAK